jgi:hypothetical protein
LADRSYIYELVGEPLNIDEVARDMIRIAGRKPGVDITFRSTIHDPPASRERGPHDAVHPDDDRLVRVPAPLCGPVDVAHLVDDVRELVDAGDETGVHKFVRTLETRLSQVCDWSPLDVT